MYTIYSSVLKKPLLHTTSLPVGKRRARYFIFPIVPGLVINLSNRRARAPEGRRHVSLNSVTLS